MHTQTCVVNTTQHNSSNMFFRQNSRRPSISSITSTSTLGETTDAHAHTHVTMHAATSTATRPSCSPRSFDYSRRQSSACSSERSCESLSSQETIDLWRCMLALQERYGCYNSRRIDLAMDAGEEAIINLMRTFSPNRRTPSYHVHAGPKTNWSCSQPLHH
jgi:hypothetical protein